MERIPPASLIIDNKIGGSDPETIEKLFADRGDALSKVIIKNTGMKSNASVLDMGCGLGRVARGLVDYLTEGTYTGVDIVKSSIDWCEKHYADAPNFSFHHAEIFSTYYNPEATVKARDYRFPFPDNSFDVIFSTSLFTHMMIDEVDNYLGEMARTLKPGGWAWNTYMILDDVSEPLAQQWQPKRPYITHPVDGGRVAKLDNPELIVGLYLDRLEGVHARNGLSIERIQLSNWSGGRPEIPYKGQDIIIARKPIMAAN